MQKSRVLFLLSLAVLVGLWALLSSQEAFRSDYFPYFSDFLATSLGEFKNGRFLTDFSASMFRWCAGFFLSVGLGVPAGLFLGKREGLQRFLSPYLNVLRSLSPLAWIPFAVIWFGIGDAPVIFLLFLGCFFPMLFTTMSATHSVPKVYDEVAREYDFKGSEYFSAILFPAVLPHIYASARLIASLGWIVLVPAEMLAGKEGLGFAILDARNGLRTDLLVFNMLMVALTSHGVDLLIKQFATHPSIRWAHEQ